MKEPIRHFLEKEGFNPGAIKEWVIGEKYVGIMLENGNIGVCATLDQQVNGSLLKGGNPDPDDPSHRIILNAWFNAICNYRRSYTNISDIFDNTSFTRFSNIVMVGYFESLYEKFKNAGIPVKVFDLLKESPVLSNIAGFYDSIALADAVILTGTSIFNGTFSEIVSSTSENSSVFLLGPSNTLSFDMFAYPGIKVVYGSVFEPFDRGLFDRISEGRGTRGFIEHLKKVYISSENI